METRSPSDLPIPFAMPKLSSEVERQFVLIALEEIVSKTIDRIPSENYLKFQHGKVWNYIVYENGKAIEQLGQMQPVKSTVAIGLERVVEHDAQVIPEFISQISGSMAGQMSSAVYQKMHEAALKSGAVFEFSQSGISLQHYLEIVKKCECIVDENGKVSRPELFNIPIHLKQKLDRDLANAPVEYKEELEAIWTEQENKALKIEKARLSRFDKI